MEGIFTSKSVLPAAKKPIEWYAVNFERLRLEAEAKIAAEQITEVGG